MDTKTRDDNAQWVETHVKRYAAVRPQFKLYAETLIQVLTRATRKLDGLAIIQARAKAIPSFAEKLVRKRTTYRDPLIDMTDLCGVRVITHTSEQVHAVCRFLETHFDVDWENSDDVSQRLRPTEFGYRSVHYIVSFQPGRFPTPDIPIEIPESLFQGPDPNHPALKAEIQVRTILEHAWADINHDMTYKSGFAVPARYQRQVAALAAVLEGADREFARIHDSLRAYASDYGKYLTRDEILAEIATLELVLTYDPDNAELANRIATLAMSIDLWPKAIDVLRPYQERGYQPAERNLGIALCREHAARPQAAEFLAGRRRLETATAAPHVDPEGLCALADTWRSVDDERARELHRQAVERDPTHPTCLCNYLEYELAWQRTIDVVQLMAPSIRGAIERCRKQIEAGVDLAHAYRYLAWFHLLLDAPYDSLAALAKAIHLCTSPFMLQAADQALKRLRPIADKLKAYEWLRRLLLLGQAAKYRDRQPAAFDRVLDLASSGGPPLTAPVVIVAGGCDPAIEQQMQGYRELLREAFRDFTGTILAGGTTQGISGLVGDLREHYGARLRTIGYIPELVPSDATIDHNRARYDEIRRTRGQGFTPLEPLQNWCDLLAAGIAPGSVKVLGINGGTIASVEYRIAAALGAQVGLVERSGREAARLVSDRDWEGTPNVLSLPADPMTLRAFIGSGPPQLTAELCEVIARGAHEAYRRNKAKARSEDESLQEWERLSETLRNSNRQQASHILEKLREIGCDVQPAARGPAEPFAFTGPEIERLAEMEHGRWNAERLLDGWRFAPQRDVARKLSPHLIPWQDLPDDVKQWDRAAVREIPALLELVGLRIVRQA